MSETMKVPDDADEAMYQMRMQEAKKKNSALEQAEDVVLQQIRNERKEQKNIIERNDIAEKYGEKRGNIINEEFNSKFYQKNPSDILKEAKNIVEDKKYDTEQNERLGQEMIDVSEMTEEDKALEEKEIELSKNVSEQTAQENKKRLRKSDEEFLNNF